MLLAIGLTASIPALPTTFAVGSLAMAWLTRDASDPEPIPADVPVRTIAIIWAISAPLAIIGIRSGLRLVRGHRTLILFLRRFGYDDAEMVPIGVAAGTRRAFSAGRTVSKTVLTAGPFLGLRTFPYLISAMWGVIALALVEPAIEFARTGVPAWETWVSTLDPYVRIVATIFDGRAPIQFVGPTLPGVFAVLAMAATLSFVVMMASMAVLLVALPLTTVLVFLSSSADSIQEAERSKAISVASLSEVRDAAVAIAKRSRKVFGPRLVVLNVASQVWREAVSELASLSSLPLIDISEPTEHVLWEVEELTRRFGQKCVFVGRHERVTALAALPQEGTGDSVEHRLSALLSDQEVLAYTTDPQGARLAQVRGHALSRV